jgi:hypothetical protein
MGPNLYDWSQWSDAGGALILYGVTAVIAVGCVLKLLPPRWDDWIDERWGRGSVRDWWLLHRIDRDDELHEEQSPS